MPTQILLDLQREALATLWKRLPEHCRREAIAVWARRIADAAQRAVNKDDKKKGSHR